MTPEQWRLYLEGLASGLVLAFLCSEVWWRATNSLKGARGGPKAKESARKAKGRNVKVRLHDTAWSIPTKAYPGDAGWDLYSSVDATLFPGDYGEIPCDLDLELPAGTFGLVHGRSSSLRKGLLVNTAVIDQGYRGPMFAGVQNVGPMSVTVKEGDRVAQLLVLPLLETEVESVDELSSSERGASGFGSSGR